MQQEREQKQKEKEEEDKKTRQKLRERFSKASEKRNSPYLQRKQVSAYGIRCDIDKNKIITLYPMYDENETMQNLQEILPEKIDINGRKTDKIFQKGLTTTGLYNVIPHYNSIIDGQLIRISEGYATAASCYESTGCTTPHAVSFSDEAYSTVVPILRRKYPNSHIQICADGSKDPTKESTGITKAKKALKAIGNINCSYVVPIFREGNNKDAEEKLLKDFNDLMIAEGKEEVKAQIEQEPAQTEEDAPKLHEEKGSFRHGNYLVNSNGLYFLKKATSPMGGDKQDSNESVEEEIWISSPIWVKAYLRDSSGENHTLLIKVFDGEKYHTFPLQRTLINKPTELNAILLGLGQNVPVDQTNQKHLQKYLINARPEEKMRCVLKGGWHGDQYVFPDGEVVGEAEKNESVYPLNPDVPKGLKQKGTIEDWLKNVWEICRGNTRLIFSIGVAFSAPCMYLVDEDSGGFNWVGGSSIGKSRCLLAAISVFGSPDFKRSWKNTSNGFEAICALHNDLLLPMDEGGQADPKEIGENIYMFSQGQGKGRMYKDTNARDSKDWRAMLLSTSENGINVLMQDGKKKPKAGQLVRIADIPAEVKEGFGCFESLHGFENGIDGEVFAEKIKSVCREYYGTAGRNFIRAIINHGVDNAKEDLNNLADDFCADVARKYDGQVKRVANRFGLVYASLSLGIKLEVLKGSITDDDVKKAVTTCFQNWLSKRGTTGNMESHSLIQQVEALMIENSDGKFVNISDFVKDDKIRSTLWGCRDGSKYYVFCSAFTEHLCHGYEKDVAIETLIAKNILDPDLAGNQKKINGINTRCYLIDLSGDREL